MENPGSRHSLSPRRTGFKKWNIFFQSGVCQPCEAQHRCSATILFFSLLEEKKHNTATIWHLVMFCSLNSCPQSFTFVFFFPFVLSFSLFLGTSHSWTGWHRSCSSSFHSFETCWLVTGPVYAPLLLNRGCLFQHFFLSLNLFFSSFFSLFYLPWQLSADSGWWLTAPRSLWNGNWTFNIRIFNQENIGSEVILLIKWEFWFILKCVRGKFTAGFITFFFF